MKFLEMIARLLSDAGHKCQAEDEMSVLKALGDLVATGRSAAGLVMIAKSLGQPETSSPEQLVEALKAATTKEGMISKSVHDEVAAKLHEATVELLLLKNANRITPANREFAKSLAMKDEKMFEQWLPTQAEVPTDQLPPLSGNSSGENHSGSGTQVTSLDIQLAKSFGAIKKDEDIKRLITIKPHEITSELFGQAVSETAHDKAHAMMNNAAWASVQ
jgi:hypothetical protein